MRWFWGVSVLAGELETMLQGRHNLYASPAVWGFLSVSLFPRAAEGPAFKLYKATAGSPQFATLHTVKTSSEILISCINAASTVVDPLSLLIHLQLLRQVLLLLLL